MTQTGYDVQEAADLYWVEHGHKNWKNGATTHQQDAASAFAAGAAWQKERDTAAHNTLAELAETALDGGIAFQDEMRNAIGTLGEGMAEALQCIKALQVAGLRGSDRGVAILKHLQEIGDNVRGVGGAIGDKFGVVLDHIKAGNARIEEAYSVARATASHMNDQDAMLGTLEVQANRIAKDIGEKVEAVQSQLVDIELIAARVEGHVTEPGMDETLAAGLHKRLEMQRTVIGALRDERDKLKAATTEPMHAKVKAADYDESGLGKLWADVTVNLEDVSDETLHDLSMSGQIPLPRYVEERARRVAEKIDLGDGLVPRVDHAERSYAAQMRMGVDLSSGPDKSALMIKGGDGEVKFMGATAEQFAVVELSSGAVIILWEGKPYLLRGMDLHPLRFVA